MGLPPGHRCPPCPWQPLTSGPGCCGSRWTVPRGSRPRWHPSGTTSPRTSPARSGCFLQAPSSERSQHWSRRPCGERREERRALVSAGRGLGVPDPNWSLTAPAGGWMEPFGVSVSLPGCRAAQRAPLQPSRHKQSAQGERNRQGHTGHMELAQKPVRPHGVGAWGHSDTWWHEVAHGGTWWHTRSRHRQPCVGTTPVASSSEGSLTSPSWSTACPAPSARCKQRAIGSGTDQNLSRGTTSELGANVGEQGCAEQQGHQATPQAGDKLGDKGTMSPASSW